jgi:predicted outer membrane repeat protein
MLVSRRLYRFILFTLMLVGVVGMQGGIAYAYEPVNKPLLAGPCDEFTFPYTLVGNASAELRQAIECANANSTADVIDLNGQTITLTDSFGNYNGNTGLPQITSDVTIRNGTITSIPSDPPFRAMYIGSTGTLSLDAIGISNNNHVGLDILGGGIYNAGTLTINSSSIDKNLTNNNGGGIYNTGTLTINSSLISDNTAITGGGIYSNGTLTITNSIISDNITLGGSSGGIYNSGELIIIDSTISNNTAASAAGLHNTNFLSITGSSIISNTATTTTTYAGGIYNSHIATIDNSIISGNHAQSQKGGGGGISNIAYITVTNSLVSGNRASNYTGGGIYNTNTIVLNNTTIAGNYSGTVNGGLVNISSGTSTLNNSIIYGNEAPK